ncbi:sigma-70 family RNA polymerase sigma factor [Streptomyces sp. PLK6-54]|uniref:Sigma-70 family RNA polymerase sigma factor n=1 Tax=Actinacidiphila acidipaludis TaxID=2873382 RepID=A0ABS7QE63_9ACTN|nr:sigma-70 family RNA polymerase sigma factor [Streptomyces acidipaludis]
MPGQRDPVARPEPSATPPSVPAPAGAPRSAVDGGRPGGRPDDHPAPGQDAGGGRPAALSDAELVDLVRAGQDSAYEELYRRHAESVRRYARTCCRDAHTAEDLTGEVFARTLQAIRGGSGPESAVRAYLLTTVRRVAATWGNSARREHLVEDFAVFAVTAAGASATEGTADLGAEVRAMHEAEQSLAVRAFRTLPERWQTVLWHTAVEEESPSAVAPLLGLTPNATAVLAHRAREGLRQAYLQAHVSSSLTAEGECARFADRLGAHARGGLRMRADRELNRHLKECSRCTAASLELADLNSALKGLLPVAYIGWFAAVYAAKTAGAAVAGGVAAAGAAGGAAAAAAGSGSGGAGASGGAAIAGEGLGAPIKAGIATAVVVAAAATALAFALTGGHGRPAPAPAPQALPSSTAPVATEPPSPAPEPPPSKKPVVVPPPPVTKPAAPAPPPAPAATASPRPAPVPTTPAPPPPTPSPTPTPTPTSTTPPSSPPPPPPVGYPVDLLPVGRHGAGADEPVIRRSGPLGWLWDRSRLSIGGEEYRHGITVHAPSSVTIDLNRACVSYDARAGVDDLTRLFGAAVRFSVYGDGARLWSSGPVHAGDRAVPVHVGLAGVSTLRLVVDPLARGLDAANLADWADPVITCG